MQISTQSRKRLLFAALFLAILVPLFFTLEIRSQLPLLGFEAGSPLIDWVHQNTTGSGFLRKVTGDATFYSLVLLAKDSRLGALLFFQSIVCAAIALVLLWVTLYCKRAISHRLRSPIRFCPRSFTWPPWATTPSTRRRRNTAS